MALKLVDLTFTVAYCKNPGRIEALFTLYFLGLLVQALIERELRTAMRRARIAELPLYPEERRCKRPTTEQVLRLFSPAPARLALRQPPGHAPDRHHRRLLGGERGPD